MVRGFRRLLAGSASVLVAGACSSSGQQPVAPSPTTVTAPAPASTAATSGDPGMLPPTMARPTSADPTFQARIQSLWRAISDGQPNEALAAFFPLSAYLQVKALHNPAADWQQRLIGAYDRDILALHRRIGAATFLGIDVPDQSAVWVAPGREVNKIGYWRVYGTRVRYLAGGQIRSFPIASLISWRGQWYVVHFAHLSR